MKIKYNYYSLEKEKKSFWYHLWGAITIPAKIPGWIISFLFARNITNIALNPGNTPQQRDIHFAKTSQNPEEDIVVINFKPRTSYKWFNDILIKLTNTLTALPFITPELRSRLQFDKTRDKKHIDWLLNEIDLLLSGTSAQKHCEKRTFDWSRIHLKGLEFLDTRMRSYLYAKLHQKYGPESYAVKCRLDMEFFTLKTVDGSELDSAQVNGPGEQQKPMSERRFVITCIARDQNFISWIKDLNYTATRLGATAISFNYRGVDFSRGMVWTENNMVEDVMSQVQRLIALGAKPENICLDGMCLGGAVATLAAAMFHDQGMPVKLNNERSFRSLPMMVYGFLVPEIQTANWWNPLTYLRFIGASLAYVTLTPFVWLAGWSVNAGAAWDRIPAKDKIYSLARDEEHHLYDGMVNDQISSMASVVKSKLNAIKKKVAKGESLTEDEMETLKDAEFSPDFKPSSEALANPHFKYPHFISRQDLVAVCGHREEYTNHDYFLERLRDKYNNRNGESSQVQTQKPDTAIMGTRKSLLYRIDRPLIIASSAEEDSITKANELITLMNRHAILTQYYSEKVDKKPLTFDAMTIRAGIWLTSFRFINTLVNGFTRLFGYPSFPEYNGFWNEMDAIQQREEPLSRPYMDMLLDVYPTGPEYAAVYKAAQKYASAEDFSTLLTYRGDTEERYTLLVKEKVLDSLCNAAKQFVPYSQLISTQGLSVNALCDAVIEYNTVFLPQFNEQNNTDYSPIDISLYLPDSSSSEFLPCLTSLDDLSIEQRQTIKIFTPPMTESDEAAFLGPHRGYKNIQIMDEMEEPMPPLESVEFDSDESGIDRVRKSPTKAKLVQQESSLVGQSVFTPIATSKGNTEFPVASLGSPLSRISEDNPKIVRRIS